MEDAVVESRWTLVKPKIYDAIIIMGQSSLSMSCQEHPNSYLTIIYTVLRSEVSLSYVLNKSVQALTRQGLRRSQAGGHSVSNEWQKSFVPHPNRWIKRLDLRLYIQPIQQ